MKKEELEQITAAFAKAMESIGETPKIEAKPEVVVEAKPIVDKVELAKDFATKQKEIIDVANKQKSTYSDKITDLIKQVDELKQSQAIHENAKTVIKQATQTLNPIIQQQSQPAGVTPKRKLTDANTVEEITEIIDEQQADFLAQDKIEMFQTSPYETGDIHKI